MFERGSQRDLSGLASGIRRRIPAARRRPRKKRILGTRQPKVVFDDEAGKESIRIEGKDGQKVEWDPKAGKITIEATAKVVVKAPEVEVGAA